MRSGYLLDSTLIIDHFNEVRLATEFLLKHMEESVISVVTLTEVLSRPSDSDHIDELELLGHLTVIPVEEADARQAAIFRQRYRLKLPDAFQAALAQRHGLRLVTRNSKDFDPKKFPFVLIPYKI